MLKSNVKWEKLSSTLQVSEVYPTIMGEHSRHGIGAPCIFLRLSGCHIRCYHKTLGSYCDTPASLEKNDLKVCTIEQVITSLLTLRSTTGIKLICLSGGDPLWRPLASVRELFIALTLFSFDVVVETSGIDHKISPYLDYNEFPEGESDLQSYCKKSFYLKKEVKERISFIVDYKGISAGIPNNEKRNILRDKNELNFLRKGVDWIKFVLYNLDDYTEFKFVLKTLPLRNSVCVGTYWGGAIGNRQLIDLLIEDNLMGQVHMNMQAHKMILLADQFAVTANFDAQQI